jgi:hypothetical protein
MKSVVVTVDKGKIAKLRSEIKNLQPKLAKLEKLVSIATPAFSLAPVVIPAAKAPVATVSVAPVESSRSAEPSVSVLEPEDKDEKVEKEEVAPAVVVATSKSIAPPAIKPLPLQSQFNLKLSIPVPAQTSPLKSDASSAEAIAAAEAELKELADLSDSSDSEAEDLEGNIKVKTVEKPNIRKPGIYDPKVG